MPRRSPSPEPGRRNLRHAHDHRERLLLAHVRGRHPEGDGRQDILVAKWNEDYSSQTLSYLKNNGDGTFGEFQELSSGFNNVLDIASVDFDGDGDLDMLAAASNGAGIVLTKNNGDGTFVNRSSPKCRRPIGRHRRPGMGTGRSSPSSTLQATFRLHRQRRRNDHQRPGHRGGQRLQRGEGRLRRPRRRRQPWTSSPPNSNRKELTWYKGGGDARSATSRSSPPAPITAATSAASRSSTSTATG